MEADFEASAVLKFQVYGARCTLEIYSVVDGVVHGKYSIGMYRVEGDPSSWGSDWGTFEIREAGFFEEARRMCARSIDFVRALKQYGRSAGENLWTWGDTLWAIDESTGVATPVYDRQI